MAPLLVLALGLALLAGCSGEVPAPGTARRTVTVSAASSLRTVMLEAGAKFRMARPGTDVRFNFGASNLLARQLREGAPVDLFISADERAMDEALASGRVDPGSRRPLGSNSLVVIIPAGAPFVPKSLDDLRAASINRIALCDNGVPVGHYARAWLAAKGALSAIEARLVRPEDARATLAMVESGNVDAGFVYRTDAIESTRAIVAFEVPAGELPMILYFAAALRDGPEPQEGRALLEFLGTRPVRELFQRAGFEPAGGGGGSGR